MFETDQYQASKHQSQLQRAAPYEAVTDITHVSRMVWGEHCIECAAPACFSTCDLYQARPDGRCRRLVFGQYLNPQFPSWRGYGAEVHFKQWAKLEARGNLYMEKVAAVRSWENLMRFAAPTLNHVGGLLAKLSGDPRWSHLFYSFYERWTRSLHRRKGRDGKPDGFLLEIYNPGEKVARIQFVIHAVGPPGGGTFTMPRQRFAQTFDLVPKYSRHFIETGMFQYVLDQRSDLDISLIPEADNTDKLVILTADFVKLASLRQVKKKQPEIKCLVWDLDNTLWNGVLLENANVQLRPRVLAVIRQLDQRGIIHSIVSKNSHQHAWERLEALGVAEFFICPQINWLPKSQNISQVAKNINIGIDTIAFVDDNPFELDEVAQTHPEVTVIHASQVADIPAMPCFAGSSSSDARNRRRYYLDAQKREVAQQEAGQDIFAFLRQSAIVLTILPYDDSHFERIAELVQRTNQLNHSGQKYSRDELRAVIADSAWNEFVLICEDRYGSYGTVGFGIVRTEGRELQMRDFMLSCRVQGKFIEQAFLSYLVNCCGGDTIERIWVNYRPTDRNAPAWSVLSHMGFKQQLGENQGATLVLTRRNTPLRCEFIKIRTTPSGAVPC